ncbi:MAG: M13 family metallopeptidase [bacterium]
MKQLLPLSAIVAVCLFLFSCGTGSSVSNKKDALAAHIDSTVKPGDDFFLFANGKWFRDHPIPASEQSNGLWQLIRDTINSQILNICQSSAKMANEPKGSNKQKIGDLYYSGMDSISINNKGLTELKPYLDRIDAVTDLASLAREVARVRTIAGSPLFALYVGQDDRISSKYAIFINQGGLSLPERSYYFDKDPQATRVRQKFGEYMNKIFGILGYPEKEAAKASEGIMKLETEMARKSRKLEDTRDPNKNYNKYPIAQLRAMMPDFRWDLYLETVGLKNVDTVIAGQPEFLLGLNASLKAFPIADLKNYLKIHLIRGLAPYLDDKTYLEMFRFYYTTLRGVPEPRPRWKRVVDQTDDFLGPLIGQVYIKEYLPEGTKEKLTEIGNAIKAVYAERIKALDWMSDATKKKALSKLDGMIMKVGYPDQWKDMSKLQITRDSYLLNAINSNNWWVNYTLSKFGKPVDRLEWGMDPQNYNAYYNPSNNEICVPGCNIIVPGYERVMADDAILYAIIGGSTFGHEMIHGFDDQGCKYDEKGNLNNWWTADDSIRFFAKTGMIVKQFDKYVAVDSLHINGSLTQGENIADLAGILLGYQAFQKRPQYTNREVISGLTPDQRYFLGYALAWMINDRPEAVANQVRSDVHSPAKFRVNGPLADVPEFYMAFGVKEGDALWLPDSLRVKIW